MQIGKLTIFGKRVIGEDKANPLLIRWILFCHPSLFGIYLHKLCRSDHARALHDHPWWFRTLILKRGYDEIYQLPIDNPTLWIRARHTPGTCLFRPAKWRHRVVIVGKPAWTLVVRGPSVRRWGFWPNGKFCWWRKYDGNTGICNDEVIHGDE